MNRREFERTLLGGAAWIAFPQGATEGYITDVDGLKVGHFTDARRPTGCTVILTESGAVGGVDVRGAAPGTRETDLLDPVNTVEKVNAIVLSGGSAFGLATATGVVQYLDEKGIGYPAGPTKVPIVPAAILFDLGVGDHRIRPDAKAGYDAAKAAKTGPFDEGNVGAGAGATVGKFARGGSMKGGIGTSSIRLPNGIVVGAIIAVNAVGNVVDPKTGKVVAGSRKADSKGFNDAIEMYKAGTGVAVPAGQATTIGLVATNAALTKAQVTKVAQMAHDGLARCIYPVHTPGDGDTLFAVATGTSTLRVNHGAIGALAAEAVVEAVLRAVRKAKSIPNIPAAADYPGR